jgi:transcriptional regulator with XRE-family HTH domain
MRIALREANISVADMAAYLGVDRSTVSTWMNNRIKPSTQTLRLWSLRCGVPYEWLKDGEWAPWDSNPQPTDYKVVGSGRLNTRPSGQKSASSRAAA